MDLSSEPDIIPIVFKSNYMLEAAIKDGAMGVMLAGEFNLAMIEALVVSAVKEMGLENNLSRKQVRDLILEGMAEGMKN